MADQPAPRELNSWKEIALHLGVNVRSAQKWEREGRRRFAVFPARVAPGNSS